MRLFFALVLLIASALPAADDPRFEEAYDLYLRGRFQEALQLYQQITKDSPKFAGAWYEMGLCQKELRQFGQAANSFRQATNLSPNLAPAWAEMGASYVAAQKWDEAVTALQQAVKLDAKNAEAFANLGYAMWQKADPDNAEKMLKKAISLDATHVPAYVDLGNLYLKLAKTQQGLDLLRKGFELDPTSKSAVNAYTKAVQESGSDRDKAYMSAWQAEVASRFQEAEQTLLKLVAEDPADFRSLALLGHVYLHQSPSKPNDSIMCYLDAITQESKAKGSDKLPVGSMSLVLEGLGIAHLKVGEYAKAEEQFKKGKSLDKENAWFPYDLALSAAMQGKGSAAVTYLTEACKLDPEMAGEAKDDPGFDAVRANKDFQKVLTTYGD